MKIFAGSIFFPSEPPVSFFSSTSLRIIFFIGEPLVPIFFFLVNLLLTSIIFWGTFCFNFFPEDLPNQFFCEFHHAPQMIKE